MDKENWLVLAHCFNMDGRAASQTITDKIPFLIQKGVNPIVVSAPTGLKDKDLIHKQVLSIAPSGINFELRKIVEKKYRKGGVSQLLKAVVSIFCLPFLVLEKLILNLDSHWSWFITAGIQSTVLIRRYKPQIIYSTAGPSSTHLTAYILKRIFYIPWIAEIHDPLVTEEGKQNPQRHAFHRWLERAIFDHANAVIYFTRQARENAMARTGVKNNSYLLRPGANPPEIKGVKYEKRGKIHFGHFGSLAADRNLERFFKGLDALFQKRPGLKDKVVVDIYGTMLDARSRKILIQLGLDRLVVEHGRLEFDALSGKSGRYKVVEQMHLCDVLLILHGNTAVCDEYIPSKVYEYLLTQRPIIGITSPDSELDRVLDLQGHFVMDNQVSQIEVGLEAVIDDWENDRLRAVDKISGFTVKNAVGKLFAISRLIKA